MFSSFGTLVPFTNTFAFEFDGVIRATGPVLPALASSPTQRRAWVFEIFLLSITTQCMSGFVSASICSFRPNITTLSGLSCGAQSGAQAVRVQAKWRWRCLQRFVGGVSGSQLEKSHLPGADGRVEQRPAGGRDLSPLSTRT